MTDLRTALIARMNAVLETHTARVPSSIPVVVPTAALADAAINVLAQGGGVPRVPAYDAGLFAQRRWHQPVLSSELNLGIPAVNVDLVPDPVTPGVQVTITNSDPTIAPANVILPPIDAEEFLLCGLAVVAAARANTPT